MCERAVVLSDVLFCLHLNSSKKVEKSAKWWNVHRKWPYHMFFFNKSDMSASEKLICYVLGLGFFFGGEWLAYFLFSLCSVMIILHSDQKNVNTSTRVTFNQHAERSWDHKKPQTVATKEKKELFLTYSSCIQQPSLAKVQLSLWGLQFSPISLL